MHAYAGPACICRMHAPSMLIPPSQGLDVDLGGEFGHVARACVYLRGWMHAARARVCVWVYMGGLGGGVWVRVRTRRVRACVRACVVLV